MTKRASVSKRDRREPRCRAGGRQPCCVKARGASSGQSPCSLLRPIARVVKEYLETEREISVEWLLPYAPELGPEEYCQDSPDLFDTKLTNFDHLTPQQRRDVLQHYRGYVQFVQGKLITGQRFVASEGHIAEAERIWILRALDHRIHLISADLQWIEGLEAKIDGLES